MPARKYDAALKALYTKITSADIFEVGATGESFLDSWPLKDLIAKQITPELLADIAAAYKAGRRLFMVTTDLDAERSMVWNMGAIAAHAADRPAAPPPSTCSAACCWPPAAFPAPFRRC